MSKQSVCVMTMQCRVGANWKLEKGYEGSLEPIGNILG